MFEFMHGSDRDVLGVRATGKLSTADYHDVLAPRVEKLLNRFGVLKVLFLLDEPFRGWTLGAAWANTVFDLKHRRDFAKVAVVGAPRWERYCVNVAAVVMSGELRSYDRDQLAPAWLWLRT
ncbi:STAS/SEC14 domain-containing protein [Mycobacterium kansasii]|nr:STAS/SEC14 domain-containing protein [Mycobacterium kansasii]POY28184.1 STAS/SEC14 domain-containing protein [Mycobacterium kansasii]POY33599.1 STAS/SEC14 domain-containing protein [Mycobacterium kansasii]